MTTPNSREEDAFTEKWNELGIPNGCLVHMRDFHHQELQKAREEERERVNKILAGHGKGCDPRYHAECIEMIYEDVNQSELDQLNK